MSGVVKLFTASTEEPVSRAELKAWLRLDELVIDEDDLIDGLVTRARQRFEEVTQRSCLVQTFDYFMDQSPAQTCPILLPKAPLVDVTSITGFQTSDATDTGGTAMSTGGYYIDTASEFGRVWPLSAYSYPTATREINAMRVRFTAGYSSGSSGVPEGVKTEIKQIAAALYEHRGDEPEQTKILEAYGGAEFAQPTWG